MTRRHVGTDEASRNTSSTTAAGSPPANRVWWKVVEKEMGAEMDAARQQEYVDRVLLLVDGFEEPFDLPYVTHVFWASRR